MNDSWMSRGMWINRAEAEATSLQDALIRYQSELIPPKKGSAHRLPLGRGRPAFTQHRLVVAGHASKRIALALASK